MALATLIGGSGFLGRALVQRLQAADWAVRVCARNPERADLPVGVTVRACDAAAPGQLDDALAGSDAVVYLPGLVSEADQTFQQIHRHAAANAAAAAHAAGARRFVYLSALGVRAGAPGAADRTKAAGEAAVRDAFPGAEVVRPSMVVGVGDHFVSATARMLPDLPIYPLLGSGRTRFQPIHRNDLTDAVVALLARPGAGQGRTYELAGPEVWTLAEVVAAVRRAAGVGTPLVPVPFWLAGPLARAAALVPGMPLSLEQVRLLRTDKVAGGHHPTCAELGVTPRRIGPALPEIVRAALD
jgi:NADH dehydrogenase